MKLVFNTSPLIFLAKLNRLDLLKPFSVLIPQEVYDELVIKECAEKDALKVYFAGKNVTIFNSPPDVVKSKNLGEGELAVINLALKEKVHTVIMDDKRARSLARTVGLQTYGILWILISAYKKRKLSKGKTYELICDLPLHGFRIDQSFFLQILKKLK